MTPITWSERCDKCGSWQVHWDGELAMWHCFKCGVYTNVHKEPRNLSELEAYILVLTVMQPTGKIRRTADGMLFLDFKKAEANGLLETVGGGVRMITYRLTSAGCDALLAMPADIKSHILGPETIAKAKENLKG